MMTEDIKRTIKKLINLPFDFYLKANIFQLALVRESGYFELYEQIHEDDISAMLHLQPELIDQWLQWSDDNRSSSRWGFGRSERGKCLVGHWPEGEEFDDIETSNQFYACAAYIKGDLESIRLLFQK